MVSDKQRLLLVDRVVPVQAWGTYTPSPELTFKNKQKPTGCNGILSKIIFILGVCFA